MRIAFDTNILAYAAGLKRVTADPEKVLRSRALVEKLGESHDLIVAAQVFGELYNVMVKGGVERIEARDIIEIFEKRYGVAVSSRENFNDAFALAVDHRLQIWDALILATSAAAGCTLLISEDMQDGFSIHGITIVNPFARRPHARLAALLAD